MGFYRFGVGVYGFRSRGLGVKDSGSLVCVLGWGLGYRIVGSCRDAFCGPPQIFVGLSFRLLFVKALDLDLAVACSLSTLTIVIVVVAAINITAADDLNPALPILRNIPSFP